jgi:hypothetical protein
MDIQFHNTFYGLKANMKLADIKDGDSAAYSFKFLISS